MQGAWRKVPDARASWGNNACVIYAKAIGKYRFLISKASWENWITFCNEVKKGLEATRLDKNPVAIPGTFRFPNGEYRTMDE